MALATGAGEPHDTTDTDKKIGEHAHFKDVCFGFANKDHSHKRTEGNVFHTKEQQMQYEIYVNTSRNFVKLRESNAENCHC